MMGVRGRKRKWEGDEIKEAKRSCGGETTLAMMEGETHD